jgi:hypothetical protein
MPLDPAKSGGHEVCSTVHIRLHGICITDVRGLAAPFSGKTGATVWRRSDCYRGRFHSGFCEGSLRYSAQVGLYPVAGRNKVAPRR